MLHVLKKMPLCITLVAAAALLFYSCDDDDSPTGPSEGKKDLAVIISTESNMYVGTTSLSKSVEDGEGFFQHHNRSVLAVFEDWLFVLEPGFSGNLYRYTLDDNNNPGDQQSLAFGAGSGASHIAFVSATKAYVSLPNLGKLAIVNPSQMTKTSEIDLSSYAAGNDGSPDPTTSIIRGNHLFVALSQQVSPMQVHDTAGCVAIIDITTDEIVKVIWDERIEGLGGLDESNATVFMDEDENIYFYSNGVFGYQPNISEGFLRIKQGETEFDSDFQFSISKTALSGVPGEAASLGMRFVYHGNGIVYSSVLVPGLTSNPPDYLNDRNSQPVAIDLINKTITKLNISPTNAFISKAIFVEQSGTMLWGQNANGSAPGGLYRFDQSTQTLDSSPVLNIDGDIYIVYQLEG
jgi:hypothetical protein